jgi:hypothetical protein
MTKEIGLLATAAALLCASAAAGLSPADKCEANKVATAGKYGACRLKAESKAIKKGVAPDHGKCDAKYADKFAKAEAAAGGACPTSGDLAALQGLITQHSNDVVTALNGGGLPQCAADLALCLAQPTGRRLRTAQTICYDGFLGNPLACAGSGQDGELQKGLARSYVDNGDGTITDTQTGLMWEKQSDDGSIHDQDTTYIWGNGLGVKVATLNSTNFAGYNDWRLPNVNELQSLIDYATVLPAVDAAFNGGCIPTCAVTTCSCTSASFYWTSTSSTNNSSDAWVVDFNVGGLSPESKVTNYAVRAVRDSF